MRRSIASLLCMTVFVVPTLAADVDPAEPMSGGGYYGDLSVAHTADFSKDNGDWTTRHWINFNAKLAHELAETPWGWQVDAELGYGNLSWVSPGFPGLSGYRLYGEAATHLTYRPDDNSKLGFIAGYNSDRGHVVDASGGGFGAGDLESTFTRGVLGVGIEGMTEVVAGTWLEGRALFVDPLYQAASISHPTGSADASDWDLFGNSYGGQVSVALHHQITDSFSLRGDAVYFMLGGEEDYTELTTAASVAYTAQDWPAEIAFMAGHRWTEDVGNSDHNYYLGSQLKLKFGAPAEGSMGRMFRSGILGLGF